MGCCLSKSDYDEGALKCFAAASVQLIAPAGEQQQHTSAAAAAAAAAATAPCTGAHVADFALSKDTATAPALDPAAAAAATGDVSAALQADAAAAPPAGLECAGGSVSSADVAPTLMFEAMVMQRVRAVLQGLSAVAADGSRGSLGQAATVLLQQLQECGADTIILTAAAPGSAVCVLGGCAGVGAHSLQQQHQQLLLTDPKLAAAVCSTQPQQQPYLYQTAADELAPNWAVLQQQHGLRSFLAMRVGGAHEAVGVLTMASLKPSAFLELWWDPLLSMLSAGLLPLLGHPLMAGMCKLAHELEAAVTRDYRAYSMLLLQRSTSLLEGVTRMQLAVRLGLLSSDGQWLLVQHIAAAANPAAAAGDADAAPPKELKQAKLPARGSLFSEALAAHAPRLVADTSLYTQARARPSVDVHLGGDSEASLVVVPLKLHPGVPHKAALYVLHDKPGDFADAKRPICVLASMLQLLLQKQLQEGGLLTAAWQDDSLQQQQVQRQDPLLRLSAALPAPPSLPQPPTASALVQMLQQQVRTNQQVSQAKLLQAARSGGYLEDLQLNRVLGRGGFGLVYAGTWKGFPAAVKVMTVPQQQRRIMKGAMEIAVQESLSHPNIVRVFACLFDMVEEAVSPDSGSSSSAGSAWVQDAPLSCPALVRFRPAGPEDVEAGFTCNIMVMEYCEGGTLKSAVRAGLMHETGLLNGRKVVSVTMWKLLTVLLDVARSLEYVHRLSLLHCDLKPANVLFKTSPDSPVGLVAKLADFGLVKIMTNDRMYIRNKSISGTITHLAPERYESGSRLTQAVDIYAFGMLMFEAYTRQRPFPNQQPVSILQAVVGGVRPDFPPRHAAPYKALAEACWQQDAQQRPPAGAVVQQLQAMLACTGSPSLFAQR